MKIYVDFDDCLCETGRYFAGLAARLFGCDIAYEEIFSFDLDVSFSLTEEQFSVMMTEGHRPETLLSLEETPGASETLRHWLDRGYEVSVITGRPYAAYDASREWLDRRGLERVPLFILNKYADRWYTEQQNSRCLALEDYYRMPFDFAVEDSPRAFRFFSHLPDLKVLVFDRHWNRTAAFPTGNYARVNDWQAIQKIVK